MRIRLLDAELTIQRKLIAATPTPTPTPPPKLPPAASPPAALPPAAGRLQVAKQHLVVLKAATLVAGVATVDALHAQQRRPCTAEALRERESATRAARDACKAAKAVEKAATEAVAVAAPQTWKELHSRLLKSWARQT